MPPFFRAGLLFQLAKHQISPSGVGLLIHTHVHMDHAGQDHLVPNARIWVQRRELQNAAAPDMFPVQFYDRINVARLVSDHWHRVDALDGEQEVAPGVRCIPFPGHTPGIKLFTLRPQAAQLLSQEMPQ